MGSEPWLFFLTVLLEVLAFILVTWMYLAAFRGLQQSQQKSEHDNREFIRKITESMEKTIESSNETIQENSHVLGQIAVVFGPKHIGGRL